jgi:hypothetical protein
MVARAQADHPYFACGDDGGFVTLLQPPDPDPKRRPTLKVGRTPATGPCS